MTRNGIAHALIWTTAFSGADKEACQRTAPQMQGMHELLSAGAPLQAASQPGGEARYVSILHLVQRQVQVRIRDLPQHVRPPGRKVINEQHQHSHNGSRQQSTHCRSDICAMCDVCGRNAVGQAFVYLLQVQAARQRLRTSSIPKMRSSTSLSRTLMGQGPLLAAASGTSSILAADRG